jgi:xanthine/uracil/vitamin C permease (AzgA family)
LRKLINFVVVAFVFSIIFTTYFKCINGNGERDRRSCQELAWYVAIASNFLTGIILLALCMFGEFIRKNIPSVALLASLSGLGFAYLVLNEYLPVAAAPMVSFLPFAIIMLGYFGESKY